MCPHDLEILRIKMICAFSCSSCADFCAERWKSFWNDGVIVICVFNTYIHINIYYTLCYTSCMRFQNTSIDLNKSSQLIKKVLMFRNLFRLFAMVKIFRFCHEFNSLQYFGNSILYCINCLLFMILITLTRNAYSTDTIEIRHTTPTQSEWQVNSIKCIEKYTEKKKQ